MPIYRHSMSEPFREKIVPVFVLIFVVIQPLLDISAYFSIECGGYNYSVPIRTALLLLFMVLSVAFSRKKSLAILFYSIILLFWTVHIVVCFEQGYRNIVSDFSYFIKVVQMPIFIFAFLPLFRKNPQCSIAFQMGVTINIYLISLSLILAYVTDTMSHTYWYTQQGALGWFYSGNAQSAILAAMVPVALAYTQRISKILFACTALLGFANLFLIGTRVAYFSIIIIALGMAVVLTVFWVRHKKGRWGKGIALLLALLLLCAGGYTLSPMYRSRTQHNDYVESKYQQIQEQQTDSQVEIKDELSPYRKLYQTYCAELVDVFGLENTLEYYQYTTDVSIVSDTRIKKRIYATMQWDRKSQMTHCFGYEYNNFLAGSANLEPENDFYILLYLYGYVGLGLLLLFLLSLIAIGFKRLLKDRAKTTVVFWSCLLSCALLIGSSVFAGHTMVRPNVSVYFSLLVALSYCMLEGKGKRKGSALEGRHFAKEST